jgi:xanthine dehydrogenase accessory factor
MAPLFARLRTMIERDGRAVLVTVTDVSGSAPREVGAAMAVAADGSFAGTIGGGALEWQALAEAQAFLAGSSASTMKSLRKSLGPDLAQCCGGRVTLTFERLGREDLAWLGALVAVPAGSVLVGEPAPSGHFRRRLAQPDEASLLHSGKRRTSMADGRVVEQVGDGAGQILLFGAGHVGRAIVLAFAPLPFRLDWIDPRPEAFPRHVPQNVRLLNEPNPVRLVGSTEDDALVLIMTHSHALDLEIATAALAAQRFPLVGVIGSATKRARFTSQMRKAGLANDVIDRVVCPIGIAGIRGKDPATIAASVAAQCLQLRDAIAIARENGRSARDPPSQGWVDRL